MSEHPWEIERLDLDAYLSRVGVTTGPPTRAALDELLEAHVRTFTFDNIDVLLDQHPGVSLDAVQSKFVGRGRGGYCFEHSTLLAAALERLGFTVERRLGRVGDPSKVGRTHCVVVVTLDGERLLADPGFGVSALRSIPLVDGVEDEYADRAVRVEEVSEGSGRGWALHRRREGGWELMHTHDELPVRPIDLVLGHHYTSTFPSSNFRRMVMISGHAENHHMTLTESSVTVRRPGAAVEHRPIDEPEFVDLLHELHVPLIDDEEERLMKRVAELRRQQ